MDRHELNGAWSVHEAQGDLHQRPFDQRTVVGVDVVHHRPPGPVLGSATEDSLGGGEPLRQTGH